MCLCSELQSTRLEQLSDSTNFAQRLEELLLLVYSHVSQNKHLSERLSFTVKRRTATEKSTQRTAKIFEYNPNEFNTTTLLKNNVQRWNADPASFWTQDQGKQFYESSDPERLLIFACLQLESSDAHSCILRRFYCIVLNRLRTTRADCDNASTIAQSIYDALYRDKSEPRNLQDLGNLIDAVDCQIKAGSRYHNIASRLGIGSLFILGEGIGRSV